MIQDTTERVREIVRILRETYPDYRKGMLEFSSPFQLLVATILAAQCTDARVNEVTKTLFVKYPTPRALADADPRELEEDIRSTGFYRQKAKSLLEAAQDIVEKYNGTVPDNLDDLIKLRGVGRKTANVVLSNAYGKPAIVVDTHVIRVSGRLGLADPEHVRKKDADKIEQDLMKVVPKEDWPVFSNLLVQLGRDICTARNPKHDICPVLHLCPTGQAEMATHPG